jgi:adenylate cyclase
VLCVESEVPYRFHEEDKASIELLGSYLAIAVQNILLQERTADGLTEPVAAVPGVKPDPPPARQARRDVVYYTADECIMVDGEYLIRSIPAKILWRLLSAHAATGRREFTNRELRLDKSLNLPEWKDNLESRLLLLRRRLEQKCPQIGMVSCGRGRFALDLRCEVALTTRP